jgi:hypothetical protein
MRKRADDVPGDWTTDCRSCNWFLDHYRREDLYLFTGMYYAGALHVLNRAGTRTIDGSD